MNTRLPPGPKRYDVRDQNEVRRQLMRIFRQIKRRLRVLEASV